MSTETEQLIDLVTAHTRNLLQSHWVDIQNFRNGEGEVKIAFTHTLSNEGANWTIKTAISFAKRIKDEIEDSINPNQIELKLPESHPKAKAK